MMDFHNRIESVCGCPFFYRGGQDENLQIYLLLPKINNINVNVFLSSPIKMGCIYVENHTCGTSTPHFRGAFQSKILTILCFVHLKLQFVSSK